MSTEMNKKRGLFSRVGRAVVVSTPPTEKIEPVAKSVLSTQIQESLPLNNQEKYLSVPDVAKMFEVADATVYRWIYKGILLGTVVGRKRKVASSEVKRFIATQNQPGTKLK